MVSCSELKQGLSSFIDGELEEGTRASFVTHLSNCSSCSRHHRQQKGVGDLLRKQAETARQDTPDLWAALSTKLPDVCELIKEDLSAYLDGELIAPAKEGVDKHLEQCSPCLKEFKELSQVNSLLSKGLKLPDSVQIDIWSGVKARLNEDCLVIRSELSAFLDREVATLRHRAITHHLTQCGDCSCEFDRLSQTGDLLRSAYQPKLDENFDLWPQIQARMKVVPLNGRDKRRSPFMSRRLYTAAASVVAGVLVATSLFVYTNKNNPSVQPVSAEAYLIEQSLGEPTDLVAYGQ